MASYQFKSDLMSVHQFIQFLPLFQIFYRFVTAGGFSLPTLPLPLVYPLRYSLLNIRAIGHHVDSSGFSQVHEALDHRLQFHLIIGRRLDSTAGLYAFTGGQMPEDKSPAPWTGISTTATIRIEEHFCI